MELSYIAIARFFGCAAGRPCGLGQRSFGLEGRQTGNAAEVLHRPFNVHRSHDEILRFCDGPVKKGEEQKSTLGVLFVCL